MASGPIPSWEIDEETVETVSDFIFGGSKITANGEGKGRFQPGSVTQYLSPKVSLMSNLKEVKSNKVT